MSINLFLYLSESEAYLGMDALLDGRIYLIYARNSSLGIWDAGQKAFVIRREKFGRVSLFPEFHWDTGEPYGTAKPYLLLDEKVGKLKPLTVLTRLHTSLGLENEQGHERVLWQMLNAECRIREAKIGSGAIPYTSPGEAAQGKPGPYAALGCLVAQERKRRRMTRQAMSVWIRMSRSLEVTASGVGIMIRELEEHGLVMNDEVLRRILHVLEANPAPLTRADRHQS